MNAAGISDPDNILGAYAYRTYEVKSFELVSDKVNPSNGIRTINYSFVLDTDQPGHGDIETLVCNNEFGEMEVYEIN